MSEIKYPLTAAQIRTLDELSADVESVDASLKVALTFHANARNEQVKRRTQFWKELAEIHGLDLATTRYKTKTVEGRLCVVVADDVAGLGE